MPTFPVLLLWQTATGGPPIPTLRLQVIPSSSLERSMAVRRRRTTSAPWLDFEPIDFSGNPNAMDAAIALTTAADLGSSTPSAGYGTPKSETIAASINQKVMKFGRTTGQTSDSVWAINVTVNVCYADTDCMLEPDKLALFTNQIAIQPGGFSAPGDSGSLIVADRNGRTKADKGKPVGLLFAGSSSFTFASPIDVALSRFGVTVDGG